MDPEQFRRSAHTLVDWIADYFAELEDYPVTPGVQPGETRARLPAEAPAEGEDFARIFADFQELIVPGMVHWQHPGFMAYFPANGTPPSLLGELLANAVGAQCMSWSTSPAATELEERVTDWLRRLVGLPDGFVGVLHETASVATLVALVAARERHSELRGNRRGMRALGADYVVYGSDQAHSSLDKGMAIVGLGRDNLRHIPSDAESAMRVDALAAAIEEDRAAGRTPLAVVATLGTTSSAGSDPLADIATLCDRYRLWLHVDAAYAGSALLLPEYRWMIAGAERVDSLVFNPHKWLGAHFECSALFVRDEEHLVRSFAIQASYLDDAATRVRNYRDWGVSLGRRFRALKLWFVLRSYGADGLRQMLRNHIEWAAAIARRIRDEPDFELLEEPKLSLVCLRHRPPGQDDEAALDRHNQELLDAVNRTGRVFLTHTRLHGRFAIRFVVGSHNSTWPHVERAWQLLRDTARGEPSGR